MKDNKKWILLGVFLIVLTAIASIAIVRFSSRNADDDISGVAKNITDKSYVKLKLMKLEDQTLYNIFSKHNFTVATTGKGMEHPMYYKFMTSDGSQWVYCIELGNTLSTAQPKNAGTGTYWNKNLKAWQRTMIERISVFGFPNVTRNKMVTDNVSGANATSVKEYQFMATQVLIWEIQQSWRNADGKRTNDTLYNLYIKNNAALKAIYTDIATKIKNYDKIPSFTNKVKADAEVKTLVYNTKTKKYSATFEDDLLADFDEKVVCQTGLTCTKKGTKLTVTADAPLTKVLAARLTKTIPNGQAQNLVVLDDANTQRTMVGKANIDSVQAYIRFKTEPLGKLKITKMVEVEGTPDKDYLKGFKFKVTGPDGFTATVTTNEDGIATIENLKYGDYKVQEVEVDKDKYIVPDDQTATINTTKYVVVPFENELKDTRKIKIKKIDSDTKSAVAGAHLYITDEPGKYSKDAVIDEWDSTLSYHTVDKNKIELGKKYYVCETKAPDGYVVGECESFEVDSKQPDEPVKVEFKNAKTTTTITKVDEKGNKLIGAVLKVLTKDGKEILNCDDCEWTTDKNDHVIEGLVNGADYVLRELEAPDGYTIIKEDMPFKGGQKDPVVMKNVKQEVVIIKKSSDGKSLGGAVLKITDKEGNVVVEPWTTKENETKSISDLPAGDYLLVEVKAPDGYLLESTPVGFTLKSTDTRKEVVMINDMTETKFSKTDAVTGEEIAGAHLEILDADGKEIESCGGCSWISEKDKKHVVKGLVNGETYRLVETQAPDGYVIAEEVVFVAGEKDLVPMENELTKTIVRKRDVETGQYVVGAVLKLVDEKGETVEQWTTDDGPKEIMGLTTGVEYRVVEVKAPEDYVIAPDSTFVIGSTEKEHEVPMYDTPKTPTPNTAASTSVVAVIVGAILVIGGAGTVIWTRKKEA